MGYDWRQDKNICYVCLRIPREKVHEYALKLWRDSDLASKMVEKAIHAIKETYKKDPTVLCGRAGRTLLAGLFYNIDELGFGIQDIATVFEIQAGSVRTNAGLWQELGYPKLREQRNNSGPFSAKCIDCIYFPSDIDSLSCSSELVPIRWLYSSHREPKFLSILEKYQTFTTGHNSKYWRCPESNKIIGVSHEAYPSVFPRRCVLFKSKVKGGLKT